MTNKERAAMAQFNVAEAKARFSELVQKAVSGEEVVIARDNRPLLRLAPLAAATGKRKPGSARGRVWMAPDFDRTPEDFGDYVR
jgi:prevent-host-death family protein